MLYKPKYDYHNYFREKNSISYRVIITQNASLLFLLMHILQKKKKKKKNVRFHWIEIVILRSQKFWKNKCDSSTTSQAVPSQITSMLSLKISILHAEICTILCNRIRNRTIIGILKRGDSCASYRIICTKLLHWFF